MTGFASQTVPVTINDLESTITVSIKSLNSRYFEAICKMSGQFAQLEVPIIAIMKKNLRRGSVQLSLYVEDHTVLKNTTTISFKTVATYIAMLKKIKQNHNITSPLTIGDVIQLPNVLITQEQKLDQSVILFLKKIIQSTINDLMKNQTQEGTVIKNELATCVAQMERDIEKIEQRSLDLIEKQKSKIKQIISKTEEEENTLAEIQKNAAYALLDKIDINEEINRFKNHLKNLSKIINDTTLEKGKRLDFTLQELVREINTVAAKCSDTQLSSLAINVKVELEKSREQVQNIV